MIRDFLAPVLCLLFLCDGCSGTSDSPVHGQTPSQYSVKGEYGFQWKAGKHFEELSVPAGGYQPPGDVLEFFQYSCAHCFSLEPFLVSLARFNHSEVHVQRVPAVFNPIQRSYARFYYTLLDLGRIDGAADIHHEVFDAIHRLGNLLVVPGDEQKSFAVQMQFAKQFGVSEHDFAAAYFSQHVQDQVDQAARLVQRYKIADTPTVIVDGRFKTDVGMAGNQAYLVVLVRDLVRFDASQSRPLDKAQSRLAASQR